ncbi:MAG: helix-turn-helix domain-containing protein [Muribaculaceae bacterium]
MVSLFSARPTNNTYGQLAKLSSDTLIEKANYFLDQTSKPDSALICFSIVTSRYQKHMSSKEIKQIAYALNRKWQIYFYSYYNYEKASEELSKALDICEGNNLNKAKILLNFGSMNHLIAEQTGDPNILAITANYYSNAIAEAKSEKAYTVYITALNNLIAIRYRQGDMASLKALSAEVASLSHAPQRPHTIFAYNFYNGVVNLKECNYDLSMHYFEQISNLFEPSGNNTYYRYMAVEGKALSLAAKGDLRQAIDILLTMEKECLQLDKRDVLLYLYNTLYELYNKNGMSEKSEEYYKKYLATRDKLISYRQLVCFSDMKFLQQIRNDEQQMAQMQYRQKLSVYGIVVLVLVVAIILILLLLVYRKSRILAQANRDLYLKNEELLANEDKERRQRIEFEQLVLQMKPGDKPKYHTYKLNDEQQQILANKIVNVFENNSEIFEPDFSAVRLAELVESPAKDVSKTINMCFNCNFNGMLNKYRVQEACRRISHQSEYANFTIEAIGNSVGYKSRSAFIAAFKHFTGLKPSEYQQMSKEESHQ